MCIFGDFAECGARSRVLPREPVGHVEMLSETKKHRIPSGILCLLERVFIRDYLMVLFISITNRADSDKKNCPQTRFSSCLVREEGA